MADNYLEKKMEQHKARACAGGVAKGKNTLLSLLDRCASSAAFDDYVVRPDQLHRIVAAAAKVAPAFSYELLAAPLSAGFGVQPSVACIVVGASSAGCDLFLLGRVVQVMALQAAELGLCARLATGDGATGVLPNGAFPVATVAVGRLKA